MTKHHIYNECSKCLYPLCYEGGKKGRTKTEVDEIIRWLTGYSQKDLEA